MTKERAKQILPLIQAFSDGKQIQVKDLQYGWKDILNPTFDDYSEYRIKPEPPKPTYRPWKPEEVPVGAAIRCKPEPEKQGTIFGKIGSAIGIKGLKGESNYSADAMLRLYEYSIDFCKTWQPCGVPVDNKE